MKRDLNRLGGSVFDVLVVGGGIYGACVAWDAMLRGLSVALVEKADFGGATSANSLKIIHGGFRYLQSGDIRRLRDSSHERRTLMRIAPHLVHPLPVVIPTYGHARKGPELLAAGLLLSDLLTADRNRLDDRQKHIPRGRVISAAEMVKLVPGVVRDGLTGGAIFHDAQVYNSERLVMAFLRSASQEGAAIANYVEATGFLRNGDAVVGVDAADILTGSKFPVRARTVIDATGPWMGGMANRIGSHGADRPLKFAKAFNVVTRSVCDGPALGIPSRPIRSGEASRFLFVAPWRGRSIIGTAYAPYDGDPDDFEVGNRDVDGFLDEINRAYPAAGLVPADVSFVHGGLLPMEAAREGDRTLRLLDNPVVCDHRTNGVTGLFSVVGVKYTTARHVARRVVDDVYRSWGSAPPVSRSADVALHGGSIGDFDAFVVRETERQQMQLDPETVRRLVYNYGSAFADVLTFLAEEEGPTADRVLAAEARHAVHEEMAVSLGDVVFRRTELGSAGHPGDRALRLVADVMAKEQAWTAAKMHQELDQVQRTFLRKHSTVRGDGSTVAGAAVQ